MYIEKVGGIYIESMSKVKKLRAVGNTNANGGSRRYIRQREQVLWAVAALFD
jgi:hypothetical protein